MFYWMKRSSGGGSEPLDAVGNMSKTEILRGIVTEKLTTAAREILAVVERTVADYEKEATGFRREIERQRRQLELLQPQVKLERTALVLDLDSDGVVVVSRDKEPEPVAELSSACPRRQTSDVDLVSLDVEDTGSLGLVLYDEDEQDEQEEQQMVQLAASFQKREDLKDPDYEMPSRSFSPRVQSSRRKPGRPRISGSQNHVDLRIRILEDSQTDVLSNTVFKKCPVQELQCPRGLQEDDFVSLLRSTFPQLAADEPLDFLTTDRTRRLQPLKLKTLTPQEVHRAVRSMGNSALYIRLKTAEDPQSEGPRRDDEATTSADRTEVKPRRKRGRPRLSKEPNHYSLRVCMLEDQPDVPSNTVLQRSSTEDLTCPPGLQEAEFLDLLRSTFPQLTGDDKPLILYRSDQRRRLQRINLTTLTPEEIYKTMKSSGFERRLLYVKLKTGEEEEEEELQLSPTNDESLSSDDAVIKSDDSRTSTSQQQDLETEEDAAQSEEDRDGDEALDGDSDWKPDPEQQSKSTKRRKSESGVLRIEKCKTPCKVCGVTYRNQASLIKHAWSHADEPQGVCGVCGGSFKSSEELTGHLKSYQKTHDCSYCGKSFFTVIGLNCHISVHTGNRPFKCNVCSKAFARMSMLSVHRWVHVAEKPHKCDICQKSFGLKAQLRAHGKMHLSRDKYHCNVCGKSVYHIRSLTRHKLIHSGERRYGCEVCGKRFKLPSALKSHEKIHTVRERPFLCHICCKTFMSNFTLTAHMRTHSGERPFVCAICSKGFLTNSDLKHHMRVHTGEAPYGCSQCGRFFKRKCHLNSHIRSHLGIKRFTCGVCGKPCARQEHLTVHMRTHNGERPYKCTMCEKAFTQSHCLKTHMKSHQSEENPFLSPSTSSHVYQTENQTV